VSDPPDENPIQLAGVSEVNGAGTMLFRCGLLATVVYLPMNLLIYMELKDIMFIAARR
jgi:hypothetical protein